MMNLEQQLPKTGRGIPRNGFRLTTNRKLAIEAAKSQGIEIDASHFKSNQSFIDNLLKQKINKEELSKHIQEESFEEIKLKVTERFKVMEEITLSVAMGISPSLILSGAGGIGKSTIVKKTIESLGNIDARFVNGKCTPTALYRLAWDCRHEGSVLIFDDSDNLWESEICLSILKQICDSCDSRMVSWHSNRSMVDDDGEEIPADFEFNGSVIFISNIDFYREANGTGKLAPHFAAMISRSFVLDMDMKNRDYFLARIEQVLFDCMDESVMSFDIKQDIYKFMTKEKESLRELSLRMVKKIHILMQTYGDDWQDKCKILLCRG